MQTLYMAVGIPASGKTTYCKGMRGVTVISSDDVREKVAKGDYSYDGNTRTFKEVYRLVDDSLADGDDVVVDATNIYSKTRCENLMNYKNKYNCVCLYFNPGIEECLIRNRRRGATVPEDVIRRMYKSIDVPKYSDGFHAIVYVEDD